MTRPNIIAKLLEVLEEAKGRGIIEAAFPHGIPAWSGPDSDRVTEECPICHEDKSPAEMETCDHCEHRYCRGCIERHAAWVSGGRWG